MTKKYKLKEKVWRYPGKAAWCFTSIPTTVSEDIDYFFSFNKRGWGSLPVQVTIGKTTWKTSIFPEKKTKTYLLPLKAEVRKKENIQENNQIDFAIELSY